MSTPISRSQRGNIVEYRLWDYDVDDPMPRSEHETALAQSIAKEILQADPQMDELVVVELVD